MPARPECFPLFAQRERHGQVIDGRAFSAMVAAWALREWRFVRHARVTFHLFKTSSRFIAALATSIHEASSLAGKFVSRLLSPMDKSFSAEDVSCVYAVSNFVNAFSKIAFSLAPHGRDTRISASAFNLASVYCDSCKTRSARWREASSHCGSFISTKACKGVSV